MSQRPTPVCHGPMAKVLGSSLTEMQRRTGRWWACLSCESKVMRPSAATQEWFRDPTAPADLATHLGLASASPNRPR